jgi:hypothetical protein
VRTLALVLLLGGCGADGQGTALPEGGPHPDARTDWCAVRAILHENCVPCHGVPPVVGPVSLVTIDHLRLWSTNHGKPIYELVRERIHDVRSPMPPVAWNDSLTPEEMGTLDAWIAAGAQPANCDRR